MEATKSPAGLSSGTAPFAPMEPSSAVAMVGVNYLNMSEKTSLMIVVDGRDISRCQSES